ncbi:MAG: hypothetical protein IPO59_13380 [Betaproteobacteria bacterium]|nr:hypothetical protein [Betaproteobacteria bacterium]
MAWACRANAPRRCCRARDAPAGRWLLSGTKAAGCGALRAWRALVAAYPITPANELLEWMAPALSQLGGTRCCNRPRTNLASVNMIIGASYGGVPSRHRHRRPGAGA